jgi:broad specificity phosphatase PhoE
MKRQLVIIRHGEGEHLTQGFFSGRPAHRNYRPAHLTEKGREQAVQAGQNLVDAGINNQNTRVVLVSPLPRTVETAEGIFSGSGIDSTKQIIEPLLTEISLGEFEGTSTKAWMESGRRFTDFSDAHSYDGETNEDVRQRMIAVLERIKTFGDQGHIILVTHALPGYELSELLTGTKVDLAVADPFFIDLDDALDTYSSPV